MNAVVIRDPEDRHAVVLRDAIRPALVIAGFPGPAGTGIPQADADARYLPKTALTGATAIKVVATLPSSPDPDTVYITTT